MSREAKILIAIAGVVIIGGVLLAIFANPQPKDPGAPVDSQSLIRDNSHMTKQASAKVNIVEFGDFQCPGCGAAHPRIKEVIEFYKDNPDVNFVFRNFPLESLHPNARIGAEAAEAAAAQGKYWEMHDLLFERQADWSNNPDPLEVFVGYASSLGMNADQFRQSVSQRLNEAVINADLDDGNALGINSTPTFYINGVKFQNADNTIPSVDDFKKKIDEELGQTNGQNTENPSESQPANTPATVPAQQ